MENMKTVLITGANGNLGVAVTREFLEKNYRVIATVPNEMTRADLKDHPNLDVMVVNLMQEKETADFIQRCIEKYRVIDAALLLVGGFAMGDLVGTSGEDLHKQIALNLIQHIMLRARYLPILWETKEAASYLSARGPH